MKAPNFAYARPVTLDEAFALLDEHGDGARVLAGGQTLLATLNMRLSEPTILVDINRIESLKGIALVDGYLRIGALVRHCEIETSALVAAHMPLLARAAPHVAHAAIRYRGTFGGSIAFADPAAEWPACSVAMDAVIVLEGAGGQRRIQAADFFIDLYETDLRRGEVVVACEFPVAAVPRRISFIELARRHGDYAIVGVAASAEAHGEILDDLRLVFFGLGNTPLRALGAETELNGKPINDATLQRAAVTLPEDMVPSADLYHSADTKLHLAGVLLKRAARELAKG